MTRWRSGSYNRLTSNWQKIAWLCDGQIVAMFFFFLKKLSHSTLNQPWMAGAGRETSACPVKADRTFGESIDTSVRSWNVDSGNVGLRPGSSPHLQKPLPGQRNDAQTPAQCDSNEVSQRLRRPVQTKTMRLPWTSLSLRNHRMLAAGLLPEVVHVRVITSPSMAGLVNPVISGRPGTPAWCQSKNRVDTQRGRAE